MGPRLTRVLAVTGAAAILIVGANAAAFAATGKSLILGKTNKANAVTTVERTTTGPALNLKTKKSTSAPFKTNAKGRVLNLNADKLDGYTSATLIGKSTAALNAANDTKAVRFKDTGGRAANTVYTIGTRPAGTYLVTFNASVIPNTAGTIAAPVTMSCYLVSGALFSQDVYAQSTVVSVGAYNVAPSFSNVLTLTGTEDFDLICGTSAGDGWATSAIFNTGEAPTLTFTKLDGVTSNPLAP